MAEEVGDIDHLVYTAGEPLELTRLTDLTPEVITGFFQTRFVGAVSAVRAFTSRLRPGGSVTLTSGIAAWQPRFGALPVALCGAMNAVTTALAVEIAPIRVNAVAPGLSRRGAGRRTGLRVLHEFASDRAPSVIHVSS